MSLLVGCPRCPAPVERAAGGWRCATHGRVDPLWYAVEASYDVFAQHLAETPGFPTYLPWPIASGWRVTDVARVSGARSTTATLSAVSGVTAQDGVIEVVLVSEEPGTGLGARVAGARHMDPGDQIARSTDAARLRVGRDVHRLWPVAGSADDAEKSVLAGEVEGRWLWLVLRPASALLLLVDGWSVADASGHGPELLDLPFGGPLPPWREHG